MATGGDANADVALQNCSPFAKCITVINEEHIDTAEIIDITMPTYNLLEYIDYHSDTSGSLCHFKRDKCPVTNACYPDNIIANNSALFKYKLSTLGKPTAVCNNAVLKGAKIAASLKYPSNFGRSLEAFFIIYKIYLELSLTSNCVMSSVTGNVKFKIRNTD